MTAWTAPRTWSTDELVTAAMMNTHVRDNLLNVHEQFDTSTGHDHDGSDSKQIYGIGALVWTYMGVDLTTGENKGARLRGKMTITFTEAELLVKTAPVGADLIIDINKDGTSIWDSTQANRVKVTDGNTEGESTSFDTTTGADDAVFTFDIDQVGSDTAGRDLTVILWYKYAPLTS